MAPIPRSCRTIMKVVDRSSFGCCTRTRTDGRPPGEDTNGLLLDFIGSAHSPAHARAAAHLARAARRIRDARPRNGGAVASEPAA